MHPWFITSLLVLHYLYGLGRPVNQSHCGSSADSTRVTELTFADDAFIFGKSQKVVVLALKALHEEVKTVELQVSWATTYVYVFGGLLDETVESVHVCGNNVEILESFNILVA